ncbi:MAG: 5'-methylthioadenosine/adenosylhomocysteine nucleosidase [Clostridium argentinense]|uniref:adenosylhomocysteine nucleosidase n=1 Tax=Clostridium faecium TaxID=2762223 RepID=A0ABR8YRG8_9CLOT|nr:MULTISPECIES: 5'-methylthioadenosine/adenosylhomocysteine nucleosidase [Clostridium]MBD8046479.1 5'-methylthioadenosine/adenosylhomocysteine nucleosidase [Clostridium faecium]MBS5823199.1 5'-methylthioadenosine/adenosylhomocysteine nucleosidase [Clostridium argentinense]MDU1348993.1 5'-methylthioadenosine/adenosylhomocysteine nucleosidase [Clostridium argentinense]
MIIGIIGAMEEEVQSLIDEMQVESKTEKANMCFNKGRIFEKEVVIVKSGIGKVNAAVCTQILVDDYKANVVINVGIAGGIGEEIYPGDIVIASDLIQHDMDTSAFGDRLGQIPRMDVFEFKCDDWLIGYAKDACAGLKEHKSFVGRIVSGDQFIADVEKIRWLKNEFNALACEMEGASIAHVAYLNKIPFIIIRSISDNANNGAHMDYEKFKDIAVKNSNSILRNMLRAM